MSVDTICHVSMAEYEKNYEYLQNTAQILWEIREEEAFSATRTVFPRPRHPHDPFVKRTVKPKHESTNGRTNKPILPTRPPSPVRKVDHFRADPRTAAVAPPGRQRSNSARGVSSSHRMGAFRAGIFFFFPLSAQRGFSRASRDST